MIEESGTKPWSRHPRSSVKKADGQFSHKSLKGKGSGAPGGIRTHNILLRSRLSTLIRTCRSERKAGENQQVVTTSDQLLAPSSSPLSRLFAMICHNKNYDFMTASHFWQSLADIAQSKD